MTFLWSRLVDAPFARVNHQCISLNNTLYVFGGHNKSFNTLDLDLHELDVYALDLDENKWSKLNFYRFSSYQWDGKNRKLVHQNNKNNIPSLRFGHSVVTWRGRGWLFGGRSHQSECSNDVFMFCPGNSRSCALQHLFPIWAKGVNISGDVPIGSDGHAAAVVHDCMFIFGGFSEVNESFTNSLYCLDFLAWNWTRIRFSTRLTSLYPPETVPSDIDSLFRELNENWRSNSSSSASVSTTVPLPREFSTLVAHEGRLFLFGGRSSHPYRSRDIYDSVLWELLPVDVVHQGHGQPVVEHCEEFLGSITSERQKMLDIMMWEENTGNWQSAQPWYSAPRRFCCLHFHAKGCFSDEPVMHDNKNPWRNGFAYWKKLQIGHGLKTDDSLIDLMGLHLPSADAKRPLALIDLLNLNHGTFDCLNNRGNKIDEAKLTKFPLGRRSLSAWAYDGHIYVAFGLLMCGSLGAQFIDTSLHFNDLWRFKISTAEWTCLRNHCPTESLQNITYPNLGNLINESNGGDVLGTVPLPRRRATATLVYSAGDRAEPAVYVFGGAHPVNYGHVLKVALVPRPPASPAQTAYNGVHYDNLIDMLPLNPSLVKSVQQLAQVNCAPIAWLIQHDRSVNLVIIVPGSRVDPITDNWNLMVTNMNHASLFLSRSSTSVIATNEPPTTTTFSPTFDKIYFDRALFCIAWTAVLDKAQPSPLLPVNNVHALFNIIVLSGFDSCKDLSDPFTPVIVTCIRRQFYQLEPDSQPMLMPAYFPRCALALHDIVLDLVPRILFTLRHMILLKADFAADRKSLVPLVRLCIYMNKEKEWEGEMLTLVKAFLPALLRSALNMDWSISYVPPDPLDTSEVEDESLGESRRSTSPLERPSSSSQSSSSSSQNFPGLRILQNFFSLAGASGGPLQQQRSMLPPSNLDALVLPHFGVVTIDTSNSLSDSCDFYRLQLDSKLKYLCLRQLKAQAYNNDTLAKIIDQMLPDKLKRCLLQLHAEQFDWRWTFRNSAEG